MLLKYDVSMMLPVPITSQNCIALGLQRNLDINIVGILLSN